MKVKVQCELCGNYHEKVTVMQLVVENRPVMVRAYCPACWPKMQFPCECFVKRTGAIDERAESGVA